MVGGTSVTPIAKIRMSARVLPRATKNSGESESTPNSGCANANVHRTARWSQGISSPRARPRPSEGLPSVAPFRSRSRRRDVSFEKRVNPSHRNYMSFTERQAALPSMAPGGSVLGLRLEARQLGRDAP